MTRWRHLLAVTLGGGAMALAGCVPQAAIVASGPRANGAREAKHVEQDGSAAGAAHSGRQVATLAGGCFWCTEALFEELRGVEKVEPGYSGGAVARPTYEQVCAGRTGHAEAIQITFDPKVISFADLLHIFFTTHDPTTKDRQGADVGTQYRSAVFYHSEEQKREAQQVIKEIDAQRIWPAPIVTEVTAFTAFYPAEEYHRNYFARNPNQGYCRVVIAPKVAKLREKYRDKLKR